MQITVFVLYVLFFIIEIFNGKTLTFDLFVTDELEFGILEAFFTYVPSFITLFVIVYALIRIKRWIETELAEPYGRKWQCKRDGLFIIYFILVLISNLSQQVTLFATSYYIRTDD